MASDPRDYKLDISSLKSESKDEPASREWLSVMFACCSVYQRVYKLPQKSEYAGRCPRCGKAVRFIVGSGGTSSRSFVVE